MTNNMKEYNKEMSSDAKNVFIIIIKYACVEYLLNICIFQVQ